MKLGVNLCFAIKRWIDPGELAKIVRDDLGLDYVQYTWDLTDPWWPQAVRDKLAAAYAKAFREAGLKVESTFGGLASYTYSHCSDNASAGNFGLQVTTNLVSSANWSAVGNAPTTNGNTITVTIPVTKTNQFFRLENQ